MLQHLIVILAAAPLFALAGASRASRVSLLRPLFRPANAWLLFVSVFLLWHWPALFRWAAASEAGRLFEELSILAAALPFWSMALARAGAANDGARALLVVAAAVATDLPGVMMVFSPRVLCAMPHEDALRFGLTALQDQQIAGLLMWVPANLVFFAIATWLFARWLSDETESPQPSPQNLVTS
jgi:putative membrane protein